MKILHILFILGALVSVSHAYLPGVAPRDFLEGEPVDLKVNKLDSAKTQLPYNYYALDFCQPDVLYEASENLGEKLSGDRIENSPYELAMELTQYCKILCKKSHSEQQLASFATRIEEAYKVNWIIDNIPAATKYYSLTEEAAEKAATDPDSVTDADYVIRYDKGFDLGFVGSEAVANSEVGTKYINNHLRLVIDFHANPLAFEGSRIVGFEVETASINHQVEGKWSETDLQSNTLTTCTGKDMAVDNKPQAVSWENLAEVAQADRDVIYTYDVVWQESDVQWASRWDLYLKMTDNEVHWFSIVNSFMIVLFLSGMVAIIMLRTLNLDFARYEELEQMGAEETGGDIDDSGWKLVHGEVFRPPTRGAMFATLIGTGVQTFVMSFITLVFALLGFLSPANRGALITTMLLLFAFTGSFSGYYSARIYKMFKLSAWKRNTFVTAFLLPSIVFSVFLFLNFLIKDEKSSGAVPFTTLVALMVLWLGIHVPLVYMGAYIGRSKPIIEPPVRINSIPRIEIPEAPFFMQPAVSILCAGALPFAAIFIELFFIMSSVWLHQFYYMFGFLFLAFLILMITCAEISIVIVYFQLCREDYHWWWRSFLAPASSGLYIFLYSSIYLHSELQIDKTVSIILYYSYMALVSSSVALVTGMVGFVASFFFVRKIYSVIKID